jgi:hypothetical protein
VVIGFRVTTLARLAISPTSNSGVKKAVRERAYQHMGDNNCSPRGQAGIPNNLIGKSLALRSGRLRDSRAVIPLKLNSPKIGHFLGVGMSEFVQENVRLGEIEAFAPLPRSKRNQLSCVIPVVSPN